jgi:phenylalanyl-tRNA synthetase alpha chain
MNIEEIKNKLSDELSAADRSEMIEAAKVAFLGKKGHITSALAGLKSVSGEERKTLGQAINALKREAEALFEEKLAQLRQLEEKALIEAAPVYDLSLPVGEKSGRDKTYPRR